MFKTSTKALIAGTTAATIIVNLLADIIPFNGLSTAEISNRFQIYFVPAGYVFSIWGLIYLLLIAFSIFVFVMKKKDAEYVEEILPWYIVSAICNCLWIFFWHYGYFLLTVLLIVGLLLSLIKIQRILDKYPATSPQAKWMVHLPFYVYLGWVSVATIANVSGVLWQYNFDGFGFSGAWWAAVMMLVAGILSVIMALRTNNKAFSWVVMWAIIGIMVKFPHEIPMIIAGMTVIALTGFSAIGVKKNALQ